MYCECGCGQKTSLAPRTFGKRGWKKGQPVRFVNGHCRKGASGGWVFDNTKNIWLIVGRDNSKRPYHRILAENLLGRPLREDEHVHHRNRNSTDNRAENLAVLSKSEHHSLHARERPRVAGRFVADAPWSAPAPRPTS